MTVQRIAPVLALLVLVLGFSAASPAPARAGVASRVDTVAITVADMDRALAFYTGVLPFERVSDQHVAGGEYARLFGVFGALVRVVRLRLGKEEIELVDFVAPEGRPNPVPTRSNDHWFQHIAIIVSDMDRAYAGLRDHGVTHASTAPQTLPAWNPNAGGIKAFYFRDPDGNHLELLEFPPDKGEPRWHAEQPLYLGIDHTAIVVADTQKSLRFWRDALGFTVLGGSENDGIEQERLNAVFGARLRITGLAAPDGGIKVEFLEYLAPPTGRPAPVDSAANDLWHWHIAIAVDDADQAAAAVRDGGGRWVSPGAIKGLDGTLGYGAAVLVRDPDGHGVLLRAD